MVKQNGIAISKADGFDAITIKIKCQWIPPDRSIGSFVSCAVPESGDKLAEP